MKMFRNLFSSMLLGVLLMNGSALIGAYAVKRTPDAAVRKADAEVIEAEAKAFVTDKADKAAREKVEKAVRAKARTVKKAQETLKTAASTAPKKQ